MINHRELSVDEKFEQLKKDLPSLAGGTSPIGDGNFSLAVTDGKSVTKIVYQPEKPEDQDLLEKEMRQETSILRILSQNTIYDVELPTLVTDLHSPEHPDYLFAYTMSRVSGTPWVSHYKDEKFGTPERYESTGRLLARFHRGIERLEFPKAIPQGPLDITQVLTVDFLDAATNKRLEQANAFLKANVRRGNIHGDINLGNVVGRGATATGLIDFTFSGFSNNRDIEIWSVPEKYEDAFIFGYEEESGQRVRTLCTATKLALWTNHVTLPSDIRFSDERIKVEVDKNLALLGQSL